MGHVCLLDGDGIDRTPRSAKARAVLVLLATVPERRRTRRWLESRLWSERGPAQAAGSLRQVLTQIRRALGPHAAAIGADREFVWLGDVEIDSAADEAATARGREFFEGADIADPAFEDWLRQERSLRAGATAGAAAPSATLARPHPGLRPEPGLPVFLDPSHRPGTEAGFLTHAVADAIGSLLSEFAGVEVYSGRPDAAHVDLPDRGFRVDIDCLPGADQAHVRVALSDAASGKVYWSRRTGFAGSAAEAIAGEVFGEIVFQAADAAFGTAAQMPRLQSETAWIDARLAAAVRSMFTFERSRVAEADRILAELIDAAPSARTYAWRAQRCQIAAVERIEGDWQRLAEEADEYACKALEFPEPNPLVLALVSQIRVMLDGDAEIGRALAEGAVASSPHNAFSHAAMCGVYLREGDADAALASARTGARIAGRSSFQPWWQALAGLAAMALGRHAEAQAHYQAAHARAPGFRAPMRHLYVLHRAAGRHDQADRILGSLRRLEPDFSLLRVRDDPAYPAATLRSSGLIGEALAIT